MFSLFDNIFKREEKPAYTSQEFKKMIQEFKNALASSKWGLQMLKFRNIPLELANAFDVGYAANGKWPHMENDQPVNQWRFGRIVFPCTNPDGEIINLYGRAVGSDNKVPVNERHAHLPGQKGVFNAKTLNADKVYICQSPFDALSMIAVGYSNVCAVFEPDNLDWDWVKAKTVVFCINPNFFESWKEVADKGLKIGKEIRLLPPDFFGGYKDINEIWVKKGQLNTDDKPANKTPKQETKAQQETQQKEPWNEKLADNIMQDAYNEASKVLPKNCLEWVIKNKPEMWQALLEREKAIDQAYISKDIIAYKKALNDWKSIIARFRDEYAGQKTA